jgi:hypothetical protein
MAAKSTGEGPAKTPKERKPKVKKRRWYRQLADVYTMTRREDPAVTWWMLGAAVGVLAAGLGLGFAFGQPLFAALLAVPTAIMVAMIIHGRRAERAAYAQIEGQPGAVGAALTTLRRGWAVEKEPVAVDPRTRDLVFRAVGRGGVVLISEGPPARAAKMLEAEKRRVQRVVPNVPVRLVQCGNEEGQVPLTQLVKTVQRTKGKLTSGETAEITKRLRALGAARLPVPKGIDPTRVRPDRKGMRGR